MKVRYDSDLLRRRWIADALGKIASISFWSPYTGTSSDSIIYQSTDGKCEDGHTVVFDYSGKLTGSGHKGSESGCAVGEDKRKFSDKIIVEMFSWFVNNGSKFASCDIGDLNIPQHADSKGKLADLWIRHKDQGIFDNMQGATKQSCSPSHIYFLGNSFEYNDLMYIEGAAKKGTGLVKNIDGKVSNVPAVKRAPLDGYKMADGTPIYLCVIDSVMSVRLRANPKYQTIKVNGDVRGAKNAVISGLLGKESNVVYVEAPVFFGTTTGEGPFNTFEDTEIQFSGLRRYAVGADGLQIWEGQRRFDEIESLANQEKMAIASAIRSIDPLTNALNRATTRLTAAVAVLEALPNNAHAEVVLAQTEIDEATLAVQDAQTELDSALMAADTPRENFVYSRGLLLGAGAAQQAMGRSPDYGHEWTKFKKKSESMLEVVVAMKKTQLTLEKGEDYTGKVADIDYGVIAIDMEN